MHVLIGILTIVTGLVWALIALRRAGVSFSPVSPSTWYRRVQWQRRFNRKPLYNLTDPVDAAAVLLLGMAKCEGEVTAGQKKELVSIFEQEFHLSAKDASDLLVASAFLLRDEVYIVDNLSQILESSARAFDAEMIASLLTLMRRIGTLESPLNAEQEQLLTATEQYFSRAPRKVSW